MRWIVLLLSIVACAMPWRAVLAQEGSGHDLAEALVTSPPDATLSRMRARPDALVEEAADWILGYDGPDGLSEDVIETAIAAERAWLRARTTSPTGSGFEQRSVGRPVQI